MKRKNPKFVGLAIFFILLGLLFPITSFLSDPFGRLSFIPFLSEDLLFGSLLYF